MQTLFIYFAVFICVLIAADALLRTTRNALERKRFVNYRLSLIEDNADRKVVYERMLKERGLIYGEQASFLDNVKRYVGQSGLRYNGARTITYGLALVLGFALVLSFAGVNRMLVLPVAAALAAAAGVVAIARARTTRIRKFTSQLPDALDVIIRSLSAGHPLPTSVSLVAREMPDPVGSEFGIMSDEMMYGTDVDKATRNMAVRVGADELNLLAISFTVQRGSGGNLAEILANLSDMIRKRTMMKAKIKAISAEGRMTSWFMLGFPFFLYGMVKLIRPDYFVPLWESGYGNMFVTVAGILMIIGMLILRKLVNFDF